MKQKLIGWTLLEARIPGGWITRDPLISQVVEAIESIHMDLHHPYLVLMAPPVGNTGENYCQTYALNGGYRCEIRIHGRACGTYQQWCLMIPDEIGLVGTPEKDRPNMVAGYYPDQTKLLDAFMAFIADPSSLPRIAGWQWMDVTDYVDGLCGGDQSGIFGKR